VTVSDRKNTETGINSQLTVLGNRVNNRMSDLNSNTTILAVSDENVAGNDIFTRKEDYSFRAASKLSKP
jgi:hypothetical protein